MTLERSIQCDQMARLFIIIWPFQTLQIGPRVKKCQICSQFCKVLIRDFKKCSKTLRALPKCRNFAKSGHTGSIQLTYWPICKRFLVLISASSSTIACPASGRCCSSCPRFRNWVTPSSSCSESSRSSSCTGKLTRFRLVR